MKPPIPCTILLLLILALPRAAAQTRPLRVDPQKQVVQLSLRECIALALAHNLEIQVEAYNPLINKQDIIGSRAVFDPAFFTNTTWGEASKQTGSSLAGATTSETRSHHLDLGLRKLGIAGTSYEAKLFLDTNKTNSRFATLNPTWTTGLELSLTQPLLKGFGPLFNTADILIAQNSRDSSVYKLQETVIRAVTDVELRYWDLVFARDNLRVKQASLELSQDLLKITKAKVDAGDLAQIDILQSETNVSLREEEIIVAENAVRDAEDALKNLVKPLDEKLLWNAELVPTEPLGTIEAHSRHARIDLQRAIQTALHQRPELQQSRVGLNSSQLAMVKARNALWPKLDVTGRLQFSGLNGNFNESVRDTAEWHFFDWTVGLAFEYPLGNRAALAAYRKSRLQYDQARLSLKRSERSIIIDVRQSHRQIATTLKRIRATQKSVDLAQRQLDAERKKFDVGLSTLFRVKEFIEDLIVAQTNAIKAQVDFLQALARMRQSDATTMERLAEQKILVWQPAAGK